MYPLVKLTIIVNVIVVQLVQVHSSSITKLERNNVLNKGLWVKRNTEKNSGLSVFRLNSFDVDEVLDNNYNLKGENGPPTKFFSLYNQREKRDAVDDVRVKKRDGSTVKPITIVDDSYKEAGLLPQTDHYNIIHNIPPHPYTYLVQPKPKYISNMSEHFEKIMKPLSDNIQITTKNTNNPYKILDESSTQKNMFNKTNLNKNKMLWIENGPIGTNVNDTSKSEVESTSISTHNKISERELFRVIGMLTKTFKRIIKQHNDIKLIHNRLQNLNNNFMRNSEQLIEKFQHFDNKYNHVVKINEKLNEKLKAIKEQQTNLKNKEEILSKHVIEFEKQRKQFLLQQTLFFNIQKQILAQNEKITYKQAQIANRQTIISHRQTNLARIFKDAHQMFTTTEKVNLPEYIKMFTTTEKQKESLNANDSIKIDLFSVPPAKELKNLDTDILKDKDAESIDDLIYKFYFNNTFIDDFIRNQLANVVKRPENKRDLIRKPREGLVSTMLYPIANEGGNIRQRRWVKHQKKKSRKNETTTVMSIKAKIMKARNKQKESGDPFITMAMTFCTELGQTQNVQSFNWCVEKTLRRLKVIDSKSTTPKPNTVMTTSTTTAASTSATQALPQTGNDEKSIANFFPDNDDLEEKLKDYELKPDIDGNVYYDRSLHISDIDPKDIVTGTSDTIPHFAGNTNNKIAMGQKQREADVRRFFSKNKRIKMA